MSDLARALLEELAGDPVALERLRELVGESDDDADPGPAAYTVRTLAAKLDWTQSRVRAAIARGELAAVKRGRGYVIAREAVGDWARAPARDRAAGDRRPPRPRRSDGPGPAARALRRNRA